MRVALITGSSTGIGLETALHLAEHGYRVFASARNPDVSEGLRNAKGRIETVRLDVDDETSVRRAVAETLERAGATLSLSVATEGGNFWKEQAQFVRDRREVEEWSRKTADNLQEQSAASRSAALSTDLLAQANRVLAGEWAAAEERAKAKARATERDAEATKQLAKEEKARVDALQAAAALETKIRDENEQLRRDAIAEFLVEGLTDLVVGLDPLLRVLRQLCEVHLALARCPCLVLPGGD